MNVNRANKAVSGLLAYETIQKELRALCRIRTLAKIDH